MRSGNALKLEQCLNDRCMLQTVLGTSENRPDLDGRDGTSLACSDLHQRFPKEANPDIDVPVYYVSISPSKAYHRKDSERLLVRPMETELRGLEGLKELTGDCLGEAMPASCSSSRSAPTRTRCWPDIRDKVDLAQARTTAATPRSRRSSKPISRSQPTIIVTLVGRRARAHAVTIPCKRRLKDEIEVDLDGARGQS